MKIEICAMCGKSYRIDPEDERFLTDDLQICNHCGDMLDALIYCESIADYQAARTYINEKCAATTHPEVKKTLQQMLEENPEPLHQQKEPSLMQMLEHSSSFSEASGRDLPYVVYQLTLKEKFFGTGSKNLSELEDVINHFYHKGYRLHTMSTATSDSSKGIGGGDRIQATLVFEKTDLFK